MRRLQDYELGLWRAACRHIDIAESVSDLLRVVAAAAPVDRLWIFGLAGQRCELLADTDDRTPFAIDAAADIIRWAERGGLTILNPRRPGRSLLAELAPALGDARVVCGALQCAGVPEGVAAWRLKHGDALDDRATSLLSVACEPLAIALETSRRFHELESLRRSAEADRLSALRRLGRESLTEPIVGADSGLRQIMDRVAMVAPQDVPVLILGETGSGKEVLARAIHEGSHRSEGPFVRVNCGAIPPELIDSQLFGHEKGAFTGATDRRLGWFERADGGTLFLDEIGELPLAAQVRLLRVVQEGSLERVGGHESIRVDCRIVAATHRDLAEMVQSRTFREDLWYRLAVFPLVIPPLRQRQGDLPELARHFARRASIRFGLPEFEISEVDLALLRGYAWPGNVRELAAVIDRAALLGQDRKLDLAAALGAFTAPAPDQQRLSKARALAGMTFDEAVRAAIERALTVSRGRVEGPGGAADLLRLNPNTLRSKIRKLGLDIGAYRVVQNDA